MLRGQLVEYKKRKHIVTIMSDLKSAKKADLKLKKADLKLKDLFGEIWKGSRSAEMLYFSIQNARLERER